MAPGPSIPGINQLTAAPANPQQVNLVKFPLKIIIHQITLKYLQQQSQNPQMTAATPNPYPPGYNLASVDMSSFSGIDWSSMYGMYV